MALSIYSRGSFPFSNCAALSRKARDEHPPIRKPLFGLSGRSPVRDSGAAAHRVIAEGQRPVSRRNELATVKERGAIEERPGKIGTVEHRFEEIRTLEMRTRQVRIATLCPPQIGAPKVSPRKIEPAQIQAAKVGRRQVRHLVMLRPPCIPCPDAASEQADILIFHYLAFLSRLWVACFGYPSALGRTEPASGRRPHPDSHPTGQHHRTLPSARTRRANRRRVRMLRSEMRRQAARPAGPPRRAAHRESRPRADSPRAGRPASARRHRELPRSCPPPAGGHPEAPPCPSARP